MDGFREVRFVLTGAEFDFLLRRQAEHKGRKPSLDRLAGAMFFFGCLECGFADEIVRSSEIDSVLSRLETESVTGLTLEKDGFMDGFREVRFVLTGAELDFLLRRQAEHKGRKPSLDRLAGAMFFFGCLECGFADEIVRSSEIDSVLSRLETENDCADDWLDQSLEG